MNDKSDSAVEMTFIKSGDCWSESASESIKCESRLKVMTVWANSGTDEHQLSHLLSWQCPGHLLFLCLMLGSLEWGFWTSFRSFMSLIFTYSASDHNEQRWLPRTVIPVKAFLRLCEKWCVLVWSFSLDTHTHDTVQPQFHSTYRRCVICSRLYS